MRSLTLFSLMGKSLTWYCQLIFVSIFTQRYLTLSIGYSLLPHNFNSNHLNFLLLRFGDLDLDLLFQIFFFTLTQILFAFINQLTRCFKLALFVSLKYFYP